MYEANSTDFKPAEGDLPNTILRFNIEEVKGQIRYYGESITDSMKVTSLVVFFLVLNFYYTIMYTAGVQKEKQLTELENSSRNVNLAVTSIDRSDIEDTEASIDREYLLQEKASEYVKLNPRMSKQEIRLRRLVPRVDVINPDEEQ